MGEFAEFFTQTAAIERATGTSSWGDTTYAASVDIDARVEHDRREVLTAEGQEVVSETQLFTEAQVDEGDKVTITVDGAAKESTVVASLKHYDLEGVFSHYEVML